MNLQVQYLAPRATLPPPFRWVYYFAKIVRYIYLLIMPFVRIIF